MSPTVQASRAPSDDMARVQQLNQGFACFTTAAEALGRSYRRLQEEVLRLRSELSSSHDENRAVKESLSAILQSLPCGVLVVSWPDGGVEAVNAECMRLLETDQDALKNLTQLRPEYLLLLMQVVQVQNEWELEVRPGSPQARWLSAKHVLLETKVANRVIFILQDATERNLFSREREDTERQRALARMSTLLAHEVRNPLESLELFAGLLADSKLDPENRMFVENLQAGLRMLGATVNNVLHFHSAPSARFGPVDVAEFLASLVGFLRPLANQAQARLRLDQCAQGVVLWADQHRLEQVVLNLAVNSLRQVSADGLIVISAHVVHSENSSELRIAVTDDGPGIPPDNLERIFEPGYSSRSGSPGLGLAVCRTIMRQHEGSIVARNLPEGGASFLLRFPLGGKQ